MIKLTGLHYKIKTNSLERAHDIKEHFEGILFEWDKQVERAQSVGGDYIPKPFVEPFEFEDEDYDITEKALRIDPKEIVFYKENVDNLVEITLSSNIVLTVKETIEEIDQLIL